MSLIEKNDLLDAIAPPLDSVLAESLLDEFISMEQRYITRDWEPAELDGGHFCETLARIIYHQDSGNLNRGKSFGDCRRYLTNDQVDHAVQPRHDTLHIFKVLGTIYKFRSQRGAAHISPDYTPNHMDSKFLIESVRWCTNETLRIFWSDDRQKVAQTIREILEFNVPAVGSYQGELIVQRTDLNAEEEMLILMHYAGEEGMSRTDLGNYSAFAPSTVTKAIQRLTSAEKREAFQLPNDSYRLTELGKKRIREELADKLLLE